MLKNTVPLILGFLLLLLADQRVIAKDGNEFSLANVTVHSSLSELNEFRPGYIYLVVENKSDTLLNVERIEIAEYPEFIDVKNSSLDTAVVSRDEPVLLYPEKKNINSRESEIYEVYVDASGQLKPGKHLLLFNVFYNGWKHEQSSKDSTAKNSPADSASHKVWIPETGSMAVSRELVVKVFGENEILGALSNAVTFLIMPGFIMVIAFAMIWSISAPSPYKEKLPGWFKETKIADVRFWVSSITMSLIMAVWLYPFLTRFTRYGSRNYLYGYGFNDIVMMWGFSLLVGGCFALASGLLLRAFREIRYRNAMHGDENPLELLQKAVDLGTNQAWLKKISIKSTRKSGYIVEQDTVDKDSFWVIPRIQALWQPGADELNERFEQQIYDEKTMLSDLLRTLAEGEKVKEAGKGLQAIDWEQNNQFVERPLQVKRADMDWISSRENIFSSTMTGQ